MVWVAGFLSTLLFNRYFYTFEGDSTFSVDFFILISRKFLNTSWYDNFLLDTLSLVSTYCLFSEGSSGTFSIFSTSLLILSLRQSRKLCIWFYSGFLLAISTLPFIRKFYLTFSANLFDVYLIIVFFRMLFTEIYSSSSTKSPPRDIFTGRRMTCSGVFLGLLSWRSLVRNENLFTFSLLRQRLVFGYGSKGSFSKWGASINKLNVLIKLINYRQTTINCETIIECQ